MITFDIVCGRRRQIAFLVYAAVIAGSAFAWMGNAGLALAILWCHSAWPRWHVRRIEWSPAEVDTVWLWGDTLAVRSYGGAMEWVFGDELTPTEFAQVRRRLKSQVEGLL